MQYLEILFKCVKFAHFNEIFLQFFLKYWIFIWFWKYFRKLELKLEVEKNSFIYYWKIILKKSGKKKEHDVYNIFQILPKLANA